MILILATFSSFFINFSKFLSYSSVRSHKIRHGFLLVYCIFSIGNGTVFNIKMSSFNQFNIDLFFHVFSLDFVILCF